MDFPAKNGSGRIWRGGQVLQVTWACDPNDYHTEVTLPGGETITVTDYEDRWDYCYRPSDDGSIFYETFVLLDPNEPDPGIVLDEDELRKTAVPAMTPLVQAMMDDQLHSDDLGFARILFTTPECLLRLVQKTGCIEGARAAIIKDFLR